MFDINGWEIIVLLLVAILVLGPERLPEYAAKLGKGVRQVRAMAEGARAQLKEQMGPEFDDINWRQYDPRQYDPRRIVREALLEEPEVKPPTSPAGAVPDPASPAPVAYDPSRPTVWDPDAT
jgi:sec-independent protein translocase protein TatB